MLAATDQTTRPVNDDAVAVGGQKLLDSTGTDMRDTR